MYVCMQARREAQALGRGGESPEERERGRGGGGDGAATGRKRRGEAQGVYYVCNRLQMIDGRTDGLR